MKQKFDNFCFIEYAAVEAAARQAGESLEAAFTMAALEEVPQQFADARRLKLI
jgi:hypothetical protein